MIALSLRGAAHFSPDGTQIIFCMFIDGGEGIYTANPDGSNVQQVMFTTDFSDGQVFSVKSDLPEHWARPKSFKLPALY